MMKLARRQYLKITVYSIAILATSMLDPVSMVSALLEEPETFQLPDRLIETEWHANGNLMYPAIQCKRGYGSADAVGSVVWLWGANGLITDRDIYLVLDGRRLKVRDYPELAQKMKEGKL
jgi:hypothetical protein